MNSLIPARRWHAACRAGRRPWTNRVGEDERRPEPGMPQRGARAQEAKLGEPQRLRLGQRLRQAFPPAEQVFVEATHQQRGGGVIDLPQAQTDTTTTRQDQSLGKAHEALTLFVLAQSRLACGQRHQVAVQAPVLEHFLGRQSAIRMDDGRMMYVDTPSGDFQPGTRVQLSDANESRKQERPSKPRRKQLEAEAPLRVLHHDSPANPLLDPERPA